MINTSRASSPTLFKNQPFRLITIMMVTLVLSVACASNPNDSRAKAGAKSGAAVGAGIGLLIGVLSGDSRVAAAAVAVGAASGASRGAYEGWRQDQDDERTRQITQAIREGNNSSQQAKMDDEARQREQLTRFLGIWQMTGWLKEPGEDRINVSAQVNGNVHMTYFVELAFIDLKAEGFDQQIWGTSTLGYDSDTGYELNTRFNTLPDAIEVRGGTFNSGSRTFDFTDTAGSTKVRFLTPDRFTLETRVGGDIVESYQFDRS